MANNPKKRKDDESVSQAEVDVLLHTEQLIREIKEGNDERVSNLLNYISSIRQAGLYNEVGKMTRQLHEALNSFYEDTRLNVLAEEEIPDARMRLRKVIEMTQESADRSLNAVEETMPKCDELAEHINELGRSWQNFKRRELTVEQFKQLSAKLENFFKDAQNDTDNIRSGLKEIMMAQDFQDITGQMITRVIELVEEVEGNLIELLRITGPESGISDYEEQQGTKEASDKQVDAMKTGIVNSQDEVDELLSSLGF